MMFEFYTDAHQFSVTKHSVSKNGEVIAEGNIFVFYLMLGHPAWFIINGDSFTPPQIIKTSPVMSILPHHEVYDGNMNPPKQVYEIDFTVVQDKQVVSRKYSCLTVDKLHAIEYVKSRFPRAIIVQVSVQQSKYEKEVQIC